MRRASGKASAAPHSGASVPAHALQQSRHLIQNHSIIGREILQLLRRGKHRRAVALRQQCCESLHVIPRHRAQHDARLNHSRSAITKRQSLIQQ